MSHPRRAARDDDGDSFREAHPETAGGFRSLPRSRRRPHRDVSREKPPAYLGFFEVVHDARRSGTALLGSLVAGPVVQAVLTPQSDSVVAMNHPKFLCIGARKAGTTWLWFNLRSHPRVWLTPQKEIHYFDRRPPSLAERLFGRRYHLRAARRHLRQTLVAQWRCWSPDDLRWAARHCLSPRDDAWYRSLFPDDDGLTTGEICPGYARLSLDRIARLARLVPDLKVVYLVRDPIEVAWSSACARFAKKHEGLANAAPETVERYLCSEETIQRYDYARNLLNWRTFFSDEQIFLVYYDDMAAGPRDTLVRILDFLGLDSGDRRIPADVAVPRGAHAARRVAMADRYRRLLARVFVDRIGVLHHLRPHPHTERWLADARSLAEAPTGGAGTASRQGCPVSA